MTIVLSGTLNLHFSSSGDDTTGDGSAATPFRTPRGAWDFLAANYDLNGQQVNIVCDDSGASPVTFTCDLSVTGLLQGQTGAYSQISITGAPGSGSALTNLTADTVKNFKWQSADNKSQFTASRGAALTVEGFFFDDSNKTAPANSRIMFNVGTLSSVKAVNFGFGHCTYGSAYVNNADLSSLIYDGFCYIEPTTASATGAMTDGSSSITLTGISLAGGAPYIAPGMSVVGNGIDDSTTITAITVNGVAATHVTAATAGTIVITVSPAADATGSNTLTFAAGVAAPIGIGYLASLLNANVNGAGAGLTWIKNYPHFLYGITNTDRMAFIDWGSMILDWSTKRTPTVTASSGSSSITVSAATGIHAGMVVHHASIPIGTLVGSIVGTTVTLEDKDGNAALTTGVLSGATVIFADIASTAGPKATAWGNSLIVPPKNDAFYLPGDDTGTIGLRITADRARGAASQGSVIAGLFTEFYGYADSRYYTGGIVNAASQNTKILPANQVDFMPFVVTRRVKWTAIGFDVIVPPGGVGTYRVTCAIYEADPETGEPYKRGDMYSDLIDLAATGPQEIDLLDLYIQPGNYWLAIKSESTITIRAGA